MNTVDHILVFCTVPDLETAETISKKIVDEKLAACSNIVNDIKSFYFWENKINKDDELLLIIKSKKSAFTRLNQRIVEIHPYSVPEVIALPIISGNKNYLNWVSDNVEGNE